MPQVTLSKKKIITILFFFNLQKHTQIISQCIHYRSRILELLLIYFFFLCFCFSQHLKGKFKHRNFILFDAKLVVELISKEEGQPNSNDVIITDCRKGLKKIPIVRVLHCYREANNVRMPSLTEEPSFPKILLFFLFPLLMYHYWSILMHRGWCMSEFAPIVFLLS